MASDEVPNSPAAADPAALSAEAAPSPAGAAAPSAAHSRHSQEAAGGARSTDAGQRPPAAAEDEDDEPWAAPAAPAPVPRQLKRLQRRSAAGATPHKGGRECKGQATGGEVGEQVLQQAGAGGSDGQPCSPGRIGGGGGGAQVGASADAAGQRTAPSAVSPGSRAESSAREETEGSDAGGAARRSAPSATPTGSGSGSGGPLPEYWDEEDELYRKEFERVKRPDRRPAPAASESSDGGGSGSGGSGSGASGAGALRSLDLPVRVCCRPCVSQPGLPHGRLLLLGQAHVMVLRDVCWTVSKSLIIALGPHSRQRWGGRQRRRARRQRLGGRVRGRAATGPCAAQGGDTARAARCFHQPYLYGLVMLARSGQLHQHAASLATRVACPSPHRSAYFAALNRDTCHIITLHFL